MFLSLWKRGRMDTTLFFVKLPLCCDISLEKPTFNRTIMTLKGFYNKLCQNGGLSVDQLSIFEIHLQNRRTNLFLLNTRFILTIDGRIV